MMPSSETLLLVVAGALLRPDPEQGWKVLITQRPIYKREGGLWEFPGGKVEPGETPEGALVRELNEELAVRVNPSSLAPVQFASKPYSDFHLLMPLFACLSWEGDPVRREHADLRFVPVGDLEAFAMPEADIPLSRALRAYCEGLTRV